MIVSWKYVIINENGKEKFFLFQCIDCIKLELSYQVFLLLTNSKDSNKKIDQKLRKVSIYDGTVDLDNFEIKIWSNKNIYKVVRDANE